MLIKTESTSIDFLLPDKPRSSGIHMSELVKLAAQSKFHGHSKFVKGNRESGEEDIFEVTDTMRMGLVFERAIVGLYLEKDPLKYVVPGEVVKNGVICTPDMGRRSINQNKSSDVFGPVYDSLSCIDEIKWTKFSMSNDLNLEEEFFWRWLCQLKGYCWACGVTTGKLHIGYACGNYADIRAAYRRHKFTFTKEELRDNWIMLCSFKGKAKGETHD